MKNIHYCREELFTFINLTNKSNYEKNISLGYARVHYFCNVALIVFLYISGNYCARGRFFGSETITGTVTSATDHEPPIGVTVKVLELILVQ